MGCDAYANKNGELEIMVTPWENTKRKSFVIITGLEPHEKISVEYLKGEQR